MEHVQKINDLRLEVGEVNLVNYLVTGESTYLNGAKIDGHQQPIDILMTLIRECDLPDELKEIYQGLQGNVPDPAWNLAHYLAIGDPTYLQEFRRKAWKLDLKRFELVAQVVRQSLN